MTRNRFRCDGPTLVNVSFGRTSAFMVRRILDAHDGVIPDDVHFVFCNTGAEHAATLDFGAEIASRWDVPVRWIERRRTDPRGWTEVDYESASRESEPFEELVMQRRFLPNAVMRFCTVALKIETAAAFMRAQGHEHWTSVVGLRRDEEHRVRRLQARHVDEWDVACPLFDAGVVAGDVAAFWRTQDFDLGIEPHLGNCVGCFLKGIHRRRRIAEERPDLLAWWAAMEARFGARFRKDGPSYQRLLDDVRADLAAQPRLHLAVVDDDPTDLAACGCTDRRPQRKRRPCYCGAHKPARGHSLFCQFARADEDAAIPLGPTARELGRSLEAA